MPIIIKEWGSACYKIRFVFLKGSEADFHSNHRSPTCRKAFGEGFPQLTWYCLHSYFRLMPSNLSTLSFSFTVVFSHRTRCTTKFLSWCLDVSNAAFCWHQPSLSKQNLKAKSQENRQKENVNECFHSIPTCDYQEVVPRDEQRNIKPNQKKMMTFMYLKIKSDYNCTASMSLLLYMNM